MINSSDSAWNTLKIWRDINQDGLTSATELFNFSAVGVQAININDQFKVANESNFYLIANF